MQNIPQLEILALTRKKDTTGEKRTQAYKVHSRNLTSRREVRSTSIWIWKFRNNLAPIVHGKLKDFVVLALRDL